MLYEFTYEILLILQLLERFSSLLLNWKKASIVATTYVTIQTSQTGISREILEK
jgi:hypothetical protein